MGANTRKTAIDAVGNVPWGTHFCQFYRTKEDLIDILVPYFKAGLENNELCIWVASEPLGAEDAHVALKKKVRGLDGYVKKDQIEIIGHDQWYMKSGRLDCDRVLQAWIDKEKHALERGFDGLRFTGNAFWLEKKDWEKFAHYESVANNSMGKYRMLGICTYSLNKCTASEIIDVVSNHQFALIKKNGEWKVIESSEREKADKVMKIHEMRLQALLDLNKMAGASQQEILDFVREEVIKITQSRFAFVGFMNDDESIMSVDNWSVETMEQCAIAEQPMRFPIAESGLWGEPVRQRRAVIINDYNAPHPAKKGFPSGHVPVERFLGVPIFDGEAIVAVAGVANKANDYDESDVRAITSMMNDTWRLLRRKRAEDALQKSEANYRAIFNSASDAIFVHDVENVKILSANQKACQMYGYTQEEFEKLTVDDISTGVQPHTQENALRWIRKAVDEGPQLFEWICKHKTGRNFWVEVNLRPAVLEGRKRMLAIVRDITERKDIEARQQLAGQILVCLNRGHAGVDLVRDVLKLVKEATGFDAVGIRHREGKDFPYLEVDGFPDDFVKAENYLCCRDEAGEIIYDSRGRPVIGCMCGNVLYGRADPTLPFFTEGGSFWTNSTTELLACTPREAFRTPTRNQCNKAGYESVALVPLRSGDEIVGLLQLNDTRQGCFTREMIRFFEEMGASIGIGMARIRAEQEIENLARFPSENPNPVLRMENWGRKVGGPAPEHWRRYVLSIFESGLSKTLEAPCKDRIFSLIMAHIAGAEYINVYGMDITDRKHAEEDLREYRSHLEELVQTRTAELTQANERLLQQIEERKRLEKDILNISEQEQRRIGRELHDSIGQQFTGIAFMTKALEQKLAGKLPGEATDATEIKKLVNEAMDQTRGLAKGLHPIDLDAGSLTVALQELAATTKKLFGIDCVFKCDGPVPIDDTEVATHLYRITQEAITNAIKHGKTNSIAVELARRKDDLVLTVQNDGLDFPAEFEARGTGMGLQIMDHRADIIGASLNVHKRVEGGTTVICSFPDKRC
ncbi:MAG: MEDS domain-containing protein [Planctomycetota bacterium]|jgi:PAS domain S-box-containing protein